MSLASKIESASLDNVVHLSEFIHDRAGISHHVFEDRRQHEQQKGKMIRQLKLIRLNGLNELLNANLHQTDAQQSILALLR